MRAWIQPVALAAALLSALLAAETSAAERPNIVLLLADDLGYGDVACYGAPDTKTPNVDRLARQGVRFTRFYANAPECTPTRTALMTGAYTQRVGGMECALGVANVGRYDDAIRLAEQHELGLPAADAALAKSVSDAGYVCGLFGKWHLGYETKFQPLALGWNEFFGCLGGNLDYFAHRESDPALHVLYENTTPVDRPGYFTHLITDAALKFVDTHHDRPFFLYLPFTTPHFPYQGPNDGDTPLADDAWNDGTHAKYVEMVEDMDAQIGRVLDALDKHGVAERTLVIFNSDNGAVGLGNNGPLAGTKSTLFEGGIRVPMVARWPGRLPRGGVSHQIGITMDLTRSILRATEAHGPSDRPLDGIDLLAHVESGAADFDRTLFWRYRRGEDTWRAASDGRMKFISHIEGPKTDEWLFDLSSDEGEQNNLLAGRSADAARLRKLLADWEQEVKPRR